MEEENSFELQLGLLKSCFQDNGEFMKCLNTMHKINMNVLSNPLNQQYYQIKLQSKTLQQVILAHKPAADFMDLAGWKRQGEFYQLMESDMEKIRKAVEQLQAVVSQNEEKPKFNPY